ncbi:MAG: hypothetical protein IPL33_21250 [Sphingobacteriales bacterium]|nr:hypothetical protein [Sphingobacteriales bacterium]
MRHLFGVLGIGLRLNKPRYRSTNTAVMSMTNSVTSVVVMTMRERTGDERLTAGRAASRI